MNRDRLLRASAILAAVLICILGATSMSHAEIKEGSTTVSIFAGGFIFDHDLNLKNGTTGGFGVGHNFTKNLGVEGVINYVDSEFEDAAGLDDSGVPVYLYHLDLLYHIMPEKRLVPYLAIGAGGITYDPKAAGIDTDTDFMANYGAGLKYFLTPAMALRGDVRHVIGCNECETSSNLLYTIGLSLAFGGKEEVPPPAPVPVPEPEVKQEVVPTPPPLPVPVPEEDKGAYVFRNIYFDFDKSTIKPESEPILTEVAQFLTANPGMKMEIQGHTDSKGGAAYNRKLSDKRAKAVKAYLVKDAAINPDRLTTKGYGLTKPVASNATEEGRAKNRRVEFAPIE